jgi:hypothetical protein
MKMIGLATLMVMAAFACRARLGETNGQIVTRYGAVEHRNDTGTNTWIGDYDFKEYHVQVYFRDNISECEYVAPRKTRKFDDEEREALMTAIAGGGGWDKDDVHSDLTMTIWINKASKAVAYLTTGTDGRSMLAVASEAYVIRLGLEKKQKEIQKANGF